VSLCLAPFDCASHAERTMISPPGRWCSAGEWEVIMKTRYTVVSSMIAGAALGAVVDFVSGSVVAQPMEKKGTTPYVTRFIFRPLMSIDIPAYAQPMPT